MVTFFDVRLPHVNKPQYYISEECGNRSNLFIKEYIFI